MAQSSCTASRHGRDVTRPYVAYCRDHCRCPDATEDWRLHHKRWREGRSHLREPALGSIRRVQALQAIGWPRWLQAEHAGLPSHRSLSNIHRRAWVYADTARAVATLYLRLQNEDGPSARTEDLAWKAGYPPPGAWVGQDIDDPATVPIWIRPDEPDRVAAEQVALQRAQWASLRPDEQAEAYRLARRYGLSQRAMQADWHVSSRVLKRLDAT